MLACDCVQVREAYRRKLELLMRDTSDMARAVAIMEHDKDTGGLHTCYCFWIEFYVSCSHWAVWRLGSAPDPIQPYEFMEKRPRYTQAPACRLEVE